VIDTALGDQERKRLVIRIVTGQHGDSEGRTFSAFIGELIAGFYRD
jgi:hypothetical protein